MKNSNSKGYSLVEIIIALLILTGAVIPLIGTITSDTQNAIVIANSEFAMQKARYILDTMLDSVEFDDLNSGDPAFLTGKSKDYFSLLMFPESDGKYCQGYFNDEKGQRYFATLKVVDIPNDDKILKFECYENPDLISLLNNTSPSEVNYAKLAEEAENPLNPVPSAVDSNVVYGNTKWAKNTLTYHYKDFFQENKEQVLMKALFLKIKWNDNNKNNPESDGSREFCLVTHKARLLK